MFHTFDLGQHRSTANYGVVVRAGDVDFYGIIREIIEVSFPGALNLRCSLFKCDWFDPVVGRGVRVGKYGVVDVNQARSYKNDPYVLASQADQVCFIPYPRVRQTGVKWLNVQRVRPRGLVLASDDVPMQNDAPVDASAPDISTEDVVLIDTSEPFADSLPDDVEDQERPEDEWNDHVDTTDDEEEDEEEDEQEEGGGDEEDE